MENLSRARRERVRRDSQARSVRAVKRGRSTAKGLPGWRRLAEDEDLLRFLTVHGVVSLRQAAHWFYGGRYERARYRARLLEQAGLLVRHDQESWAGVILVPTLDGQKVGLESANFPVSHASLRGHMRVPSQLLHRLLVAEYTLAARAKGRRVISERQIRMLDAR